MECEFCKTMLKSLSSLNYHKKTNKKCLEKQNILTDKFIPCEFCKKVFSNQTLKIHLLSCKNKKVKEKDDIIEELLKEKDITDNLLKQKDDLIEEMKNRILELEVENKIYSKDHEFVKKVLLNLP